MKKILIAILITLSIILAYQVHYEDFSKMLSIIKKEKIVKDCPISVNARTVSLGMNESDVFELFGKPSDTLVSEYGFTWNIYHENFKNYIQIGIKNNAVVGIFTNSPTLLFEDFTANTNKSQINTELGKSLDGIVKGSTRYLSNGSKDGANFDIYKLRGAYVTFFYDTFENNSLSSVNIIDCDVEESFDSLYGEVSDALKHSFEIQNFYVTNATRIKNGLAPFKHHEVLADLAFGHAYDMATNNYFSHTSQNGDTVLTRSERYNIKFKIIGENLAMGAQNSIYMHELLMNSEGHRKNLLGDFTHMGVGVAFSQNNTPYLTQNFLK